MKKGWLVFFVLLLMQGCASSPPPSFHFYLLEPELPEEAPDEPIPLALKVEAFSSILCYGGERIVCRKDPNRLEFYQYHLWAVPPGRMIAEAFGTWLRAKGTFAEVLSPFQKGSWKLLLRGEIQALEEVDEEEEWSGRVALGLRLEQANGTLLWKERLERSIPASKRNPGAVVAALKQGVDEILKDLHISLDALPRESFLKTAEGK